jgi:hypothetical protein
MQHPDCRYAVGNERFRLNFLKSWLLSQIEDMVTEVDRNIKLALSESARRAELLKAEGAGSKISVSEANSRRHRELNPRPPLHLLYTRMLSCVVLPVSSSIWESGDWVANDYKLLRDRCSRCGGFERVTENQHRTALEYLGGDEGKGALMSVSDRIQSKNISP